MLVAGYGLRGENQTISNPKPEIKILWSLAEKTGLATVPAGNGSHCGMPYSCTRARRVGHRADLTRQPLWATMVKGDEQWQKNNE